MKKVWLPVLAVALWVGSLSTLSQVREHRGVTEYMSVPASRTAQAVGAGFDNILADALYVQTLVYFGRHLFRDKEYHNVGPVLRLLTDLDPRFDAAYFYGAMMLGDSGKWDEAEALLSKGLAAHPGDWSYAYNAGMHLFLFAKEPDQYDRAAELFKKAAALPGAPPDAHFMVARIYDLTDRKDLLVAAWRATYKQAADKETRTVAERALERLGAPVPQDDSKIL